MLGLETSKDEAYEDEYDIEEVADDEELSDFDDELDWFLLTKLLAEPMESILMVVSLLAGN